MKWYNFFLKIKRKIFVSRRMCEYMCVCVCTSFLIRKCEVSVSYSYIRWRDINETYVCISFCSKNIISNLNPIRCRCVHYNLNIFLGKAKRWRVLIKYVMRKKKKIFSFCGFKIFMFYNVHYRMPYVNRVPEHTGDETIWINIHMYM